MFDFAKFGDNIAAISDSGECLRYADLADFSKLLSDNFSRSLCLNICENSLGSLAGYACMIESRIIPLMVSSEILDSALFKILADYAPRYIWLPSHLQDRFCAFGYRKVLERFCYVLLECRGFMESANAKVDAFLQNLNAKKDSRHTEPLGEVSKNMKNQKYKNLDSIESTNVNIDASHTLSMTSPLNYKIHKDLALLLSTSGSTGSVKFVRQSYDNIKANTQSITQYLKLDSTQKAALILPMHYTYGLSVINTHLYNGAQILITQKSLMQRDLWDFIESKNATSLCGVPYTYEMLKKLKFFTKNLPHLELLTQAGGKLSNELAKEFAIYAKTHNKRFIIMYGQTEATARMSYLPSDKAIEKCGSIGIAIPGGKFHLIDSKGSEITKSNTQGELIYSGKNVAMGYATSLESLAKGDEFKGILHTGDIAFRDTQGYYYIVGRKARFIKMQGRRVSLDEVDSMILSHFNIESKSVGKDDLLCIFVTDSKAQSEIKKFISTHLKITPSALKVKIIESFPRNEAGKILYSKLEMDEK